jgi:hypothetical protein
MRYTGRGTTMLCPYNNLYRTLLQSAVFACAVKQCQDNNILIVAPGGNDKGECWCIPAIIPGVLTVGAMRFGRTAV